MSCLPLGLLRNLVKLSGSQVPPPTVFTFALSKHTQVDLCQNLKDMPTPMAELSVSQSSRNPCLTSKNMFSQISKSQETTRVSEENVAKILEDALKGG